jgi:outer membrane protein assembly factor BamB
LAGQTWLYVPMGGPRGASAAAFPLTNGDAPHGSIMAFKVVADPQTQNPRLEPAWISGDFSIPEPPVLANGVLFALSTGENAVQKGGEAKRLLNTQPAVLRGLDAATGKELFNSKDAITTWVHFSGLSIANGQVYVVDHDSNVYAFGLPAKK